MLFGYCTCQLKGFGLLVWLMLNIEPSNFAQLYHRLDELDSLEFLDTSFGLT